MPTTQLPIGRLVADPFLHGRHRLSLSTISEYRGLTKEDPDLLPAVTAFHDPADPEGRYWLADGFLRYYAWRQAGRETVPVDVRAGGRREASLFACGANAEHGLPRSKNDKWKTVVSVLDQPDWAEKDDTWIAKTCSVSRTLVRETREDCATPESFNQAELRRYKPKWQKEERRNARRLAKEHEKLGDLQPDGTRPAPKNCLESALEDARRLILSAERLTQSAGRAMAQADLAYPEATRISAAAALSNARLCLLDLMSVEGRGEDRGARVEGTQENQPATERVLESPFSLVPSPSSLTPPPQPATKRAALPPPADPPPEPATKSTYRSRARFEGGTGRLIVRGDDNVERYRDTGERAPEEGTATATPENQPATERALEFQPATKRAAAESRMEHETRGPPLTPALSPGGEREEEERYLEEWTGAAEVEVFYPSGERRIERRVEGRALENQPATKRALRFQPATKRAAKSEGSIPRAPP